MDIQTGRKFLEESNGRAAAVRDRINHCLAQMTDDDIWWVPAQGSNPVGVMLQHLVGNLRQWIISGVGGEADIRDRPREFRVEEKIPKARLQALFNETLDRVSETLVKADPSQLLKVRTVQGSEQSILSTIYSAISHLDYHAGQISYVVKMRRGESYKEFWRPRTKAEGA